MALAVLVAALAVVVATGGSNARAEAACEGITTRGDWSTIRVPAELGAPAAYAADPTRPTWLFVTDGTRVARTSDGGCTWAVVFALSDAPSTAVPISGRTATIEQIVVPENAPAPGRAYLLIRDGARLNPQRATGIPHVVSSFDGGDSWSLNDIGLPPVGVPGELRAAPSDPDVLYLNVRASGTASIFRSGDGGLTWQARALPSSEGESIDANAQAYSLQVAPDEPEEVWAGVSTAGLSQSSDGGRTWRRRNRRQPGDPGEEPERSTYGIDLHRPAQGPLRIFAMNARQALPLQPKRLFVSEDGGERFQSREPTGFTGFMSTPPESLAHDARTGEILVTTFDEGRGAVLRSDGLGGRFEPVEGASTSPASQLQAARVDRRLFFALEASQIVAWHPDGSYRDAIADDDGGSGGGGGAGGGGDDDRSELVERTPTPPKPAALSPDGETITLAPGESATRRFALSLPRTPTPMDAFLVMDTSASSYGSRRQLRRAWQTVLNRVAEDGIAARYGASRFSDWPFSPWGGLGGNDFAYRRDARLGSPGRAFASAIDRYENTGDATTAAGTSGLVAVEQAITGAGRTPDGPGAPPDAAVPPGLDAGFAADRLRIVFTLNDQPFHDEPGYPGPSFPEMRDLLRRERVLHVGLAVIPPEPGKATNPAAAFADSAALALASDATARRAFDCDGAGDLETPAGAPLACLADGGNSAAMRSAASELLLAVPDRQPVSLTGAGENVRLSRETFLDVDVKANNQLPFEATFTCPRSGENSRAQRRIGAVLRGMTVARATVTVACGGAPARGGDPERQDAAPAPTKNASPGPAPAPSPGSAPSPSPGGSAPSPAGAPPAALAAPPASSMPSTSAGAAGGPPSPPPPAPIPAPGPAPASAPAPAGAPGSAGAGSAASAGAPAVTSTGAAAQAPATQSAPGAPTGLATTPDRKPARAPALARAEARASTGADEHPAIAYADRTPQRSEAWAQAAISVRHRDAASVSLRRADTRSPGIDAQRVALLGTGILLLIGWGLANRRPSATGSLLNRVLTNRRDYGPP